MSEKVYPFICSSFTSDSEEEAWKSFRNEMKDINKWINGYKYWRVAPKLEHKDDFDTKKATYRVYSRIVSSLEKLDGFDEIKETDDYSKGKSIYINISGFGFCKPPMKQED